MKRVIENIELHQKRLNTKLRIIKKEQTTHLERIENMM